MKCDLCNKKKAVVSMQYDNHDSKLYLCTECSNTALKVLEGMPEKDLTITGLPEE